MTDADQGAPLPYPPSSRSRIPEPTADAAGSADGPTGDAAVDAALTRLAELEDLPVREHVAVFDAVHGALQDRLADVED